MARYDIKHINYLGSGNNRVFLNMDIQLIDNSKIPLGILGRDVTIDRNNPLCSDILLEQCEGHYLSTDYIQVNEDDALTTEKKSEGGEHEQVILNERQAHYQETGDKRSFLRLSLTSDSIEYDQNFEEFRNGGIVRNNCTYVFDRFIDQMDDNVNGLAESSEQTQVKPIYDMKDVCIKSKNQVAKSNIRTMDYIKTEDIYTPHTKDPMQFQQIGDQTYFLFDATSEKEYTITTSDRKNRSTQTTNKSTYTAQLETGKNTSTYLYRTPQEILSTENFCPKYNIQGLKYNYVVGIDHDLGLGTYTNGNQYGEIFTTKNEYDSTYSINMSSENSLQQCRRYCGLATDGSNLFMKFYDDVGYKLNINSEEQKDEYNNVIAKQCTDDNKYTYQKIEHMEPNSVVNANAHKSNVFSVRICNSTLERDIENVKEDKKVRLLQLKKDITNAIREICENVTPANTQLFEVQFSEQGVS